MQAQMSLKYAVIVSRHGVRSPTQTAEQLSQYAADPWPDWGVAPGELTAHGHDLMKLFGAYDRAYFASRGLLPAAGCAAAKTVAFRADSGQRTLETAKALAEGMFPGCPPAVASGPAGETDPLFNPIGAGAVHPDGAVAAAAILGRIGANPAVLPDLYRSEFDDMARVLAAPAKQAWLHAPSAVTAGKGDALADLSGPLRTASTLSEVFLLEYANGLTGKDLAWGRLDLAGVRRLMPLHEAYAELARRTPYGARARGSNLLSYIFNSIQQAESGKPGPAALVIVGHDTNLSNLAGMMNISWLLPGYEPNDPVPGGALIFELWQDAASKHYSVRLSYTAQSLEQMNRALPLTNAAPPLRAPIFLPGCSSAAPDFACSFDDFRGAILAAVDPAFILKLLR